MVTELPEYELQRWFLALDQISKKEPSLWKRRSDLNATTYALTLRDKKIFCIDQVGYGDHQHTEIWFGVLEEREGANSPKRNEVIVTHFKQIIAHPHPCYFDYRELYKMAQEAWAKIRSKRDAIIHEFNSAVA